MPAQCAQQMFPLIKLAKKLKENFSRIQLNGYYKPFPLIKLAKKLKGDSGKFITPKKMKVSIN